MICELSHAKHNGELDTTYKIWFGRMFEKALGYVSQGRKCPVCQVKVFENGGRD